MDRDRALVAVDSMFDRHGATRELFQSETVVRRWKYSSHSRERLLASLSAASKRQSTVREWDSLVALETKVERLADKRTGFSP